MGKPYENLTHPKYRPDIDGLRALAVLSVVGYHAFPNWIRGGFIGVDIFFVISGFLISSIIFENLEKGSFSYIEFYSRRIKRIFPALIFVLAACFIFGWYVLLADEFLQLSRHIAGGIAFVSNFVLWQESGYFDNAANTKPLLHLWSLAVEEQFYIIWPLLLGFVWRRKVSFLLATIVVSLFSFFYALYFIEVDATNAFYSPIARFWEIMLGGILAYIKLHRGQWLEKYETPRSAIGCILIILGFYLISPKTPFPSQYTLLPTLGAVFIISSSQFNVINRLVLANKMAIWFGLISYPLYLWHWPLLVWPKIATGDLMLVSDRFFLIATSVLLAWLTYYFIERKVRSRNSNTIVISLISVMLVIGGFACAGIGQELHSRHNNAELTNILKAKLDWKFPGSQFEKIVNPDLRYFVAKSGPKKTVFIGDSNMEQYAPRINFLLSRGNHTNYNSAVIIGNQSECNWLLEVIENKFDCGATISQIRQVLSAQDVSRVVLAANWRAFDKSLEGDRQLSNLSSFLESVLGNKQLVIILNIPSGDELDPVNMFTGSRFTQLETKNNKGISFDIDKFNKKYQAINGRLRLVAKRTNAIIIDPVDTLCSNKICPIFSDLDSPLYRDSEHLTASYAENSALFIDDTLKSN